MLKTVKKESNGEQLRPHAQNKEYLFKKQQKKKQKKINKWARPHGTQQLIRACAYG